MMPFLAVSMAIMLGFAALSIGLSMIYNDRMIIRDALDAAAAAALGQAAVEEQPTYFGEKKVKVGEDEYEWKKTKKQYKSRILVNESEADLVAKSYFNKNLGNNNISYKIKDWDIQINLENNQLQVTKNRPHTEGEVTTWEENFPRYVTARIKARVETEVPFSNINGKDTVITNLVATYKKSLKTSDW